MNEERPYKYRLRVTLRTNKPDDVRKALKAVEEAFGQDVPPDQEVAPTLAPDPTPTAGYMANEVMETQANAKLSDALHRQKTEIEARKQAQGLPPDAPLEEPPKEIETKYLRLKHLLRTAGKIGVEFAVEIAKNIFLGG